MAEFSDLVEQKIYDKIIEYFDKSQLNINFFDNVFTKYPCTKIINVMRKIIKDARDLTFDPSRTMLVYNNDYVSYSEYLYFATVEYVRSNTKEIPYSLLVLLIEYQDYYEEILVPRPDVPLTKPHIYH